MANRAEITEEQREELHGFLLKLYEQSQEQKISCCFEATNFEKICDFELQMCCRRCYKPDTELIDVDLSDDDNIRLVSMSASYCVHCEELAMVSLAQRCPECGLCFFVLTMDEEILGQNR